MWCARQESNLLPCGPEYKDIRFGLLEWNSQRAIACRGLAAVFAPIAVRTSAHRYHIYSPFQVYFAALKPRLSNRTKCTRSQGP